MLRYINGRHAFVHYEEQLKELIHSLDAMRGHVMKQFALLTDFIQSEEGTESNLKKEVNSITNEVHTLQHKIEQGVHHIILRHTPQAEELRLILSIIKIAYQFDRMSQHCQSTARQFWRTRRKMPEKIRQDFAVLVEAVQQILDTLEPIILHFEDDNIAEILKADDLVDEHYKKLTIKIIKSDDDVSEKTISREFIAAKNLERLADQAIDVICEAYYIHHGTRLNDDSLEETEQKAS